MEKNISQAKPARAKKPSAQEQAKATIAKMKQTALPLPSPTTAPSELAMVPIELIDTKNQVRTVFFEDSIKELAMDIAARGILQPLLLRPTPGGRFCIIAGERRYRAASLALLTHVPALIGEIDEEAAQLMQLAENIQREDLSAADEAAAIRTLFNKHNDLQTVADAVAKSKSWVCKRLAVSAPDYNWKVKKLLEEGLCQDFELLNTINKGFGESWEIGCQMIERYTKGELGRESARALLKDLKRQEQERTEKINKERAEATEKRKQKAKQAAEAVKDKPKPWYDPQLHYYRASELLITEGVTNAEKFFTALEENFDLVREKMGHRLETTYHEIKEITLDQAGKHLFVSALGHAERYDVLDCVAGHMAASGADFDLERLINLAITAARMAAQVE